MLIAILNDTHCDVRNSADIFLENQTKFYTDTFFPYCKEHGITQVLHLGDYYDNRKQISVKAIGHNRKIFLDPLKENGMHMDIIPGNHDVYYKNTNDLCTLKELLGHYMNNIHIIMEPAVLEYGSMKIGMVPWINNQNYHSTVDWIQNTSADVICAHLELNGFDMMRGVKSTSGMDAALFKRFEMVLSGHYHTKSQQNNIHYLGNQMELTWSDCGDPKFFHVLDTETRELTPVRNPHTLFKKVVYDDRETDYNTIEVGEKFDHKFIKVVVRNKTDHFMFERYLDRIQARSIYELKIAENFQEFIGENVDDEGVNIEDTGELLNTYIENVDTDLDKDRIKNEMSDLMNEAQALDIV
jgi:DNA repair exonuclease SbcCD nuclease subunit